MPSLDPARSRGESRDFLTVKGVACVPRDQPFRDNWADFCTRVGGAMCEENSERIKVLLDMTALMGRRLSRRGYLQLDSDVEQAQPVCLYTAVRLTFE